MSAAIILAGVALFVHSRGAGILFHPSREVLAESGADPSTIRALLDALGGNARVPAALTDIGLLTLMITPVVSVIVSLVSFARGRDWTYVTFAAIVLCMLALGAVLGQV